MPNFWSKAGQFISEKISGSRTQDEDILKSCEKMKNTEKGLFSLKSVLQNFISYSEGFKKYFTDFNTSIKLIYMDSPFYNFTEEITCKHQIIQTEFEEINKKMNILFSKTSEWNVIFESSKELIKTREEKRKIYDHYEEKLSKLNKSNKKDQKYIERNEGKYTKAASEYVDISEKAFNSVNNSLKVAFELANPIIDEMITAEKKFFQAIGQSLSCFTNNEERFMEIKKNLSNPNINKDNITYDPIKYMNDKDLMKKISLNRSISSNIFASQRLSHTNVSAYSGKLNNNSNALFGRMSVLVGMNDNKYISTVTENYNNIYTNSRMTNSFGDIKQEKLQEFHLIEDDFD
jgi:hypothetical protein